VMSTLLLALVLIQSPAAPDAAQTAADFAALAKAQELWQAKGPVGYEFTIEVRCFCRAVKKPAPTFRVIAGNAEATSSLNASERTLYGDFNTIDKLFAAIRQKLSFGRYKFSVQYDAGNGIPLVADMDPVRTIADEELFFRVTGFKPIEVVRIR
jgi:hypothetical protein